MKNIQTPSHLGGHLNKTHTDVGALSYLKLRFGLTGMLDIGCGPGGMRVVAEGLGMRWAGIDGDPIFQTSSRIIIHDFTTEPYIPVLKHDLAWCVEVLEHIEERFLDNLKPAFQACSYAIITHAPPGWPGHHHVNCQSSDYWIDKFKAWGFAYLPVETEEVRTKSTMTKGFMGRTGLVFHNQNS